MSEVCTCLNPLLQQAQTTGGTDKVCTGCGHWWMPQYGSRIPAPPGMRNVSAPFDGRKYRRNDPCPCGSKKKFKHCCLEP